MAVSFLLSFFFPSLLSFIFGRFRWKLMCVSEYFIHVLPCLYLSCLYSVLSALADELLTSVCFIFRLIIWWCNCVVCVFSACNCHRHSSECYYDPEIDQRRASLNMQGEYRGGGVCIECQVGSGFQTHNYKSSVVQRHWLWLKTYLDIYGAYGQRRCIQHFWASNTSLLGLKTQLLMFLQVHPMIFILSQHHTTGINCERCISGYYRSPDHPLESTSACSSESPVIHWSVIIYIIFINIFSYNIL